MAWKGMSLHLPSFLIGCGMMFAMFVVFHTDTSSQTSPEPHYARFLQKPVDPVAAVFAPWYGCMEKEMAPFLRDKIKYMYHFNTASSSCDAVLPQSLLGNIQEFENTDESKFGFLPQDPNSTHLVVTLGIGRDIGAEKNIKAAFPGSTFYGADPIVDVNQKLYETIGTYFPVAVSGHNGEYDASVLEKQVYLNKKTKHVNFADFLSKHIRATFIDQVLIDAEGGEFGIMPMFDNGGALDKAGITICQFNMEVHTHNRDAEAAAAFLPWMRHLIQQKRWIVTRVSHPFHIRLFAFHPSKECRSKFYSDII